MFFIVFATFFEPKTCKFSKLFASLHCKTIKVLILIMDVEYDFSKIPSSWHTKFTPVTSML